jgi:YHS domain-containing protein/energy-coupling factor transporter ATP-binding protein EcfA2
LQIAALCRREVFSGKSFHGCVFETIPVGVKADDIFRDSPPDYVFDLHLPDDECIARIEGTERGPLPDSFFAKPLPAPPKVPRDEDGEEDQAPVDPEPASEEDDGAAPRQEIVEKFPYEGSLTSALLSAYKAHREALKPFLDRVLPSHVHIIDATQTIEDLSACVISRLPSAVLPLAFAPVVHPFEEEPADVAAAIDAVKAAGLPENALPRSLSIFKTFCPVSLARGRLVQGHPAHVVTFMHRIFFFSSAETKGQFMQAPASFLSVGPAPKELRIAVLASSEQLATELASALAEKYAATLLALNSSADDIFSKFGIPEPPPPPPEPQEGEEAPLPPPPPVEVPPFSFVLPLTSHSPALSESLKTRNVSLKTLILVVPPPPPEQTEQPAGEAPAEDAAQKPSSVDFGAAEEAAGAAGVGVVKVSEGLSTFEATTLIDMTANPFSFTVERIDGAPEDEAKDTLLFGETGAYCPIALAAGHLVVGDLSLRVRYGAREYALSSEDALNVFSANPEAFVARIPPQLPPARIFIFGPRGSGKSSLAAALAGVLRADVIDFDNDVKPEPPPPPPKPPKAEGEEGGAEGEEGEGVEEVAAPTLPPDARGVLLFEMLSSTSRTVIVEGLPPSAEELAVLIEKRMVPDSVISLSLGDEEAQRRLFVPPPPVVPPPPEEGEEPPSAEDLAAQYEERVAAVKSEISERNAAATEALAAASESLAATRCAVVNLKGEASQRRLFLAARDAVERLVLLREGLLECARKMPSADAEAAVKFGALFLSDAATASVVALRDGADAIIAQCDDFAFAARWRGLVFLFRSEPERVRFLTVDVMCPYG